MHHPIVTGTNKSNLMALADLSKGSMLQRNATFSGDTTRTGTRIDCIENQCHHRHDQPQHKHLYNHSAPSSPSRLSVRYATAEMASSCGKNTRIFIQQQQHQQGNFPSLQPPLVAGTNGFSSSPSPLPTKSSSSFITEIWKSSDQIFFSSRITWLLALGPAAIFGESSGVLNEHWVFLLAGLALIPCAERYGIHVLLSEVDFPKLFLTQSFISSLPIQSVVCDGTSC
jgi:hypothetical protein